MDSKNRFTSLLAAMHVTANTQALEREAFEDKMFDETHKVIEPIMVLLVEKIPDEWKKFFEAQFSFDASKNYQGSPITVDGKYRIPKILQRGMLQDLEGAIYSSSFEYEYLETVGLDQITIVNTFPKLKEAWQDIFEMSCAIGGNKEMHLSLKLVLPATVVSERKDLWKHIWKKRTEAVA